MDQVGRAEMQDNAPTVRAALGGNDGKTLKQLMWGMRRNPSGWSQPQVNAMHWLKQSGLKSARAWRLKMALRAVYAQASQINAESVQIGNDIIKSTQGGNQLMGQLASLESLKSKNTGEKPVFEDVSPEIQAAQIKMISKTGTLDERQKQMLLQAQEKRLAAQGIISQSYGELLQTLTAGFGDMVKMAAPLPALTQANNALIQSCIISAKWEQAMRAKDVAKVDMKKVEASVGQDLSKYKD
jgi:hypothetical protein